MKEAREFFMKHRGAIIGGLVAILLIALRIHNILIGIAIVVVRNAYSEIIYRIIRNL
ncbi:MAG: hypothetical protein FWC68_02605 [Oscillospiraceae bacterium]|nr:hypothetical protein [Oscillospiraceae bacterium]